MALTRPILYSTVAFDAFREHIFNFNVIGGDQVVGSMLTIINQNTGITVYSATQENYNYTYKLPPNSISNNGYYLAYIQTFDSLHNFSSNSNSIQFYCYSTPTFDFNNIPSSGIINARFYDFEVFYYQNENESLNNYKFDLYDVQGNLIATSGTLYNSNSSNRLSVFYRFDGFSNNVRYYIKATGITSQGTQISTDLSSFYVQYNKPTTYSFIELNNNCDDGYITIKSNLVEIDGKSNPSPPIYTDNNKSINLTNSGSYVLWDENYSIDDDFIASLWGHNFNINSNIITMIGEDIILKINYKEYNENLKFVELIVKEGNITYYIYSNPIIVNENDKLQIWFERIGSLYEIKLYNLEERLPLMLDSSIQGYLDFNTLS